MRRAIQESADSKVCRGRRAIRESLEKMGRTERPATPISLMPTARTARQISPYLTATGNMLECMWTSPKRTARIRVITPGARSKEQTEARARQGNRGQMERLPTFILPMLIALMVLVAFPHRTAPISCTLDSIRIIPSQTARIQVSMPGQRSRVIRDRMEPMDRMVRTVHREKMARMGKMV